MSSSFIFSWLPLFIILDHEHKSAKRTSTSSSTFSGRQDAGEFTTEFWKSQAQAKLKSKLAAKVERTEEARPKNIILFLADGLSIATSSAARVHAGGNENHDLAMDKFPHTGFSKTYCVDRQVPDSASTATAFLTGVKTNYGLIGVDSNVKRYNCEDHANTEYHTKESIAEMALAAGKAAGLVTTVRVTHATPAPLYAHSADRYWESDVDMIGNCDPTYLLDIAEQLVFGETGGKLKVVLGGGRSRFLPNTTQDEEGTWGVRLDGKDLVKQWLSLHETQGQPSEYVWNRDQLLAVDPTKVDYLLGLFAEDYMKYDYQTKEDPLEPTLSDMTQMAIKMLEKEENGFFLLVEGGRVDTAHHSTYAKTALDETRAFSDAIELALSMTNAEETLIIATADHSHTMTYNGYPDRGSDIFGMAEVSGADNLGFSTLSYANGPGFVNMYGSVYGERADISNQNLGAFNFRYYGHYELGSETHGMDDVGIYATGPQSHLFAGAYEQNALPFLMAAAAQIRPFTVEEETTNPETVTEAGQVTTPDEGGGAMGVACSSVVMSLILGVGYVFRNLLDL